LEIHPSQKQNPPKHTKKNPTPLLTGDKGFPGLYGTAGTHALSGRQPDASKSSSDRGKTTPTDRGEAAASSQSHLLKACRATGTRRRKGRTIIDLYEVARKKRRSLG